MDSCTICVWEREREGKENVQCCKVTKYRGKKAAMKYLNEGKPKQGEMDRPNQPYQAELQSSIF